jgi:hypothetical protein
MRSPVKMIEYFRMNIEYLRSASGSILNIYHIKGITMIKELPEIRDVFFSSEID